MIRSPIKRSDFFIYGSSSVSRMLVLGTSGRRGRAYLPYKKLKIFFKVLYQLCYIKKRRKIKVL